MKEHTLNTGNKFVGDIFNEKSFYNIPMYQRPYVWGEEQIHALLDDVSTAMKNDPNKEYFLGCMIWNTKKDVDLDYEYQDILDGQQRFITLYLLHGVMRDLSQDEEHKSDINKDLYQKANRRKGIPERSRVVFEIREDADFLFKYLINDNGTLHEDLPDLIKNKNKPLAVRNMANAIVIMHEWWEKIREEEGEDFQDYLDEFLTYLSRKVMLLYLATPNNLDDAYNLFTVLNSRGLQLRVSDILRAQNLRVIENDQTKKVYAKKWEKFEDSISEPFRHFDDFLWMFVDIMMKYRSDDNKSIKLAFDYMHKRQILEPGIDTINKIESFVNHYEALTNGSLNNEEYGSLFSNLNFLLINTFGNQYLSIMMLYRERFGNHRILDLLIKVDNLLTASWLTGRRISTTRIHLILRRIDFLYEKHGEGHDIADQFIEDSVLNYDYVDENSSSSSVSLEELFTSIDEEEWGSFSGTKTWKTRYLLMKLDILFADINSILHFNRSNCSIEHIMPRTPKLENNWNVSNEDHKEWIHRLGNIVLLNKKKNFSLSNSAYEVKKEKYKKQGIESRAFTNDIFMTYENWNIDTIKSNHARILDILKMYYTENSLEAFKKVRELKDILV